MPAVKKGKLMEFFWKVHPKLYKATGGRIGGSAMGMPVLLLTTKGRKSGQARTKALMYVPKGEDCVVIASFAGEPRHPGWWLNLEANPDAEVQVKGDVFPVRAREADGEERERLWKEIVEIESGYAEYARRTTRRIPVVVLEKKAAA